MIRRRTLDDRTCYKRYRFHADDIRTIYHEAVVPQLDAPQDHLICFGNGEVTHALKGLLVMLRRLSSPNDWYHMMWDYALDETQMGRLFKTMVALLLNNHGWLLSNIEMFRPHFPVYASACANRGAPMRNCIGFIDGTFWPISRPCENEWGVHNPKYAGHGLKFQNVELMSGIIGSHRGPYCGSESDPKILAMSGFLERLEGARPGGPLHDLR